MYFNLRQTLHFVNVGRGDMSACRSKLQMRSGIGQNVCYVKNRGGGCALI